MRSGLNQQKQRMKAWTSSSGEVRATHVHDCLLNPEPSTAARSGLGLLVAFWAPGASKPTEESGCLILTRPHAILKHKNFGAQRSCKSMSVYGPASGVCGPPPPMVWSGRGGGGGADCEHTLGKTRVLGVLRLRLREHALGKTHVVCKAFIPPPLQVYGL